MIAPVQTLGFIRRFLVTFVRSFAFPWSGRELLCRDCVYHPTCSLAPSNDCIARAGSFANRGNRSAYRHSLIDWWSGLGP